MPWWGGWDARRERERMVDHQLRDRGIRDERVLEAFRAVPREAFVGPELQRSAYEDRPLDIGLGQTISQPWVVAVMLEALDLRPSDRLLEVGVGSGYAIALASHLVAACYGIERMPELADAAGERLAGLGYEDIAIRTGDGTQGWPEVAPFDAILVSAGGREVPAALVTQLAPGGRMAIPVDAEVDQELLLITRDVSDEVSRRSLGPVRFVPLVPGPVGQDANEG
jgi:protein-L-isoaspartate(D-aspartate) O-methyltransferase